MPRDPAHHREQIRRWLMSRGLSEEHIHVGLAWYDGAVSQGQVPGDDDVLAVAEASHAEAVARILRDPEPPPAATLEQLGHAHQQGHVTRLCWQVFAAAVAGGVAAALLQAALALWGA